MTAVDPQPEPEQSRRPLGDIFVELGFITRDQLDDALEVQDEQGGRLGEILVAQGILSRLDLASALAEHWEPRDLTPRPGPSLASLAPVQSSFSPASGEHDGAEAPADVPEPDSEAPARRRWSLRRRPAPVDNDLEERLDAVAVRLAALDGFEAKIAGLQLTLDVLGADRTADADVGRVRFSQLESHLDRLEFGEDAFAAIEERLTALTRRCTDLEVELLARTTETAALRARVAELHEIGCVAFAPTAVGYRLVELSGGPPELGATIELEDSEDLLVVTRLGRSPLPFDSRPCVYLDRA